MARIESRLNRISKRLQEEKHDIIIVYTGTGEYSFYHQGKSYQLDKKDFNDYIKDNTTEDTLIIIENYVG